MKPNTKFELSVRDLEVIEQALNAKISRRANFLLNTRDPHKEAELSELRALLGKIHQQKNWYRPNSPTYVSG
jgi:hypothetical protein